MRRDTGKLGRVVDAPDDDAHVRAVARGASRVA
jgi:hypothetical protein